jgi:hypothetical protein
MTNNAHAQKATAHAWIAPSEKLLRKYNPQKITQTASGVIKKQSCPKSNYELPFFSPWNTNCLCESERKGVRAAAQQKTHTN